jgi:hypothetical protein
MPGVQACSATIGFNLFGWAVRDSRQAAFVGGSQIVSHLCVYSEGRRRDKRILCGVCIVEEELRGKE